MYSTCLHCTRPLGANEVIETLPIGRRLAFDAAQGRLWVVCRECAKWNLVPFDTRLESIDACERLYRDTATRYSTGTIGLAKVKEGLELVRIGPALLPEFASWRYGEMYRRRQRKALIAMAPSAALAIASPFALGAAGFAASGGTFLLWSLWLNWRVISQAILSTSAMTHAVPTPSFFRGKHLRMRLMDPASGKLIRLPEIGFLQADVRRKDDELVLTVPHETFSGRRLYFRGWEADEMIRRLLGGLNTMDGSRRALDDATGRVLEMQAEAPSSLLERIDALHPSKRFGGVPLSAMPSRERLAWEMLSNEEIERRWLDGELALLEREWREAEKLAKIADDLAHAPRLTTHA